MRSKPEISENRIRVFDTTLRDGEQSPGCSMTLPDKLRIARALADMGVDIIEAGFPVASDGDFQAVRTIARTIEGPTIAGLARCTSADIERAWEAVRDAGSPRLHVFLATSAIHREHKLKMAKEEIIRRTREGVACARALCEDVEFSPEDASRTEPEFLIEVVQAAVDEGATTINLPDTVGYALPEEYASIFSLIRRQVRGIGEVFLSAHCHNDLGMAVANSLAAIGAGARQVECTVNGIGERAGNAALEELVMAIRTRADGVGVTTGVDSKRLYPTSRLVSAITGSRVQNNKAIVGANAFRHEAGIHQHGVIAHRETYEIMRPEDIGRVVDSMVLGKHSGWHAIERRIRELGHDVDPDRRPAIVERLKEIADRTRRITDADIEALVLGRDPGDNPAWTISRLATTGGSDPVQSATVELEHTDGSRVVEAAAGDGPIDAVFKAVVRATNTEMSLVDYEAHSVSAGEDAQGESTVVVEVNGLRLNGRGVSTDVIHATAIAIMECVNVALSVRERTASPSAAGRTQAVAS